MDWSYQLLEPAERTLFARLGVFVGGCSLEAIEDAASGESAGTTLDLVTSLVDKSLLRQAEGPEGEPRFAMLETIREYAIERLEASGDAETWRKRHSEHYLALAEQAAPELVGPRQARWLERLEREHGNLRAALAWALEHDHAELGLRLDGALGRFWEVRGHFAEGRGWLERTLSRWPDGPAAARAAALSSAGSLAYHAGDYQRAMTLHEQALELRRSLGDRRGMAASLHLLGLAVLFLSDLDRAEVLCAEARTLWREEGDDRGVAITLNSSAIVARNRGDRERARAYYDESLALLRRLGDTWGVGMVLNNLARVARDLEDWDRVAVLANESLSLFEDLGDRRGVAWVLSNLAVVAGRRSLWGQAARLHGASEALREAIGTGSLGLSPSEQRVYEAAVAEIRSRLGEDALAEAMAAGRGLSPREVASGPPTVSLPTPEQQPSPLTRREREVASLVARGLTDRQISEALVITEGTVGVHLNHIFGKLEIRTRAQLAVWAAEHGLLG